MFPVTSSLQFESQTLKKLRQYLLSSRSISSGLKLYSALQRTSGWGGCWRGCSWGTWVMACCALAVTNKPLPSPAFPWCHFSSALCFGVIPLLGARAGFPDPSSRRFRVEALKASWEQTKRKISYTARWSYFTKIIFLKMVRSFTLWFYGMYRPSRLHSLLKNTIIVLNWWNTAIYYVLLLQLCQTVTRFCAEGTGEQERGQVYKSVISSGTNVLQVSLRMRDSLKNLCISFMFWSGYANKKRAFPPFDS